MCKARKTGAKLGKPKKTKLEKNKIKSVKNIEIQKKTNKDKRETFIKPLKSLRNDKNVCNIKGRPINQRIARTFRRQQILN